LAVSSAAARNPDYATAAALFDDARGVAADCEAGKYKAEACAACHGEKKHFTTRKHALIGEATRSVPAMAVDLLLWWHAQIRDHGAGAIAVTAVVGLIAYPLLQPAWVMVK